MFCLKQTQIAKGCFDIAMPYLNDRTQFGVKLADFQVCPLHNITSSVTRQHHFVNL